MELEQPLSKFVNMLECRLQVVGSSVMVMHRSKNESALLQFGTQQYRKFVDYSPSHPDIVTMNVITGAFMRVLRHTSEGVGCSVFGSSCCTCLNSWYWDIPSTLCSV